MSYLDWKEYEAGDLPGAEKSRIEQLLSKEESMRLDYAAYREYKATLRMAAMSDQAPAEKLHSMLSRASERRGLPRLLVPLVAGAAVCALALVVGPRMFERGTPEKPWNAQTVSSQVTTPELARLATSDPRKAYDWMDKELDWTLMPYKLTNVATLKGASIGQEWGAYEYEVDGKPVKIILRRPNYEFDLPKTQQIGYTTFWVGDSIGFKCPYCSYELQGGDEKTRWKLAKAAAKEVFGPGALN